MPVHDFDPPDRFVVGTVGPPGQRVFFLQASSGRRLVSVSCEKQQVSVLADRVNDILDQFAGGSAAEPGAAADEDNAPLTAPIEDEFRVATLALAWDPVRSVVVIEAFDADLPEVGEDDEEATDVQTTLTIASRVGNRRLPPLSAKFAAVEGTIDEQSVAGLTPRWHAQRGMGDTGMTALGNGYAE